MVLVIYDHVVESIKNVKLEQEGRKELRERKEEEKQQGKSCQESRYIALS